MGRRERLLKRVRLFKIPTALACSSCFVEVRRYVVSVLFYMDWYSYTYGLSCFVFLPQRAPLAPLWHLRQSSHLNNASCYYVPASPFPFFFFHFFGRALFFPPNLRWPFFASVLFVEHPQQYRKHGTSPGNQACTKHNAQVRADQSATTQASRQGWREPVCSRAFSLYSSVRSQNEEHESRLS